jgi:hypothetical protein
LQNWIQWQQQSRDSCLSNSIVVWGTFEMNCHFCQVAIDFNPTKLMAASSGWTIRVPLSQSPNSECRSLTGSRRINACLWCLHGSPLLFSKTRETRMLASSIPEGSRWRAAAPQVLRLILTCAMALALSVSSVAEQSSEALGSGEAQTATAPSRSPETNGAPVEIDGRPILLLQTSVGGLSPEERAGTIQQRILNIAKRNVIRVEDMRAEDRGAWTEILAGTDVIMGITEDDAKAAGRSRAQLGAEYAEIIRRTVATYRQEHTWRAVLRGIIASVLATVGLVVSILLLFRVHRATRRRLDTWIRKTDDSHSPNSFRSRIARYFLLPLLGTGVIVVMFAALALLEVYAVFILHSFPSTRYTSIQVNRWTVSELAGLGHAIWSYIPNLVIVIIILVAARYLVRLDNFIFAEIQEGRLTVPGFYPDWGAPTSKLVRLLILSATAVVIFPYLPGSNSPAFRGISVFLGVLLSLGSTSAVSHGVAGTILTYMHPTATSTITS